MKHRILIAAAVALICSLTVFGACALGDTLALNGTVTRADTVTVYAPIGGVVDSVNVQAGALVGEDDVLFSLRTTKVYAEEDGTVTGIFGRPGDNAATVTARYGAVLYLEGTARYTVSASTANAYNSTETRMLHVGESLYLQCRSNSSRIGEGIVTAVDSTNYTVRVTSGTFIPGDSVDLYRDRGFSSDKRVGRGTVARINPTAVTGSGAIVSFAVEDGQSVKRGDLLMETLDGSFDGLYMSGTDVLAGTAGVVGSISASQGSSVQDGAAVAVIWPTAGMRIEAAVPEDSRGMIAVGDRVIIEAEADESRSYEGTVTLVSWIAEEGSGEASYRVLIDFTPDENITFGMSVIVYTLEPEEPAAETDEAAATEEVSADARE
ncbi:MAG: HlyD family efflux transporter periplasmic adaptor subunit [Clostridia bacterium]|nr:HlyD family efflux transporter periplasmic adaptor subunit [Clostridia bacterium]